ncbi:MAG: maltose alpha-D-glucosyltransferase [Alphaproteobacteria bacterium]|nr:maltose alpha-D-glucosyltransferase [Alphaproteobacteria bacterium]MBU0886906.1 maltose alpha-D-glucosyltransferase [Alphaproteobacteria bacterium]MBU1812351.1 maltose alpha-D-glucosyltransferase [Alphaproteobacteria bacterium]
MTILPNAGERQDTQISRPRGGPARLNRKDWYKDAIVYQLHIKAFQDANGDGVGDFAGLMSRLDYVEQLGVNTIWLLPFYPSPLRDDGYDISDYRRINPSYGVMRDVKRFIAEAHQRGISVITELVINHTSDQHPWFQRARKAKPGSAARDFYVWSDTDTLYSGTRIIFLDTEKSNWTWDPEAGQFFWHRFYSHQPDLNFANPRVLEEVIRVMRFWLEMGVDGLRLDAIPYLAERDGTNNENLPETHDILKKIRTALDDGFSDRLLLAEANQWPEDTAPYFGDGDECHMAFHFPLMPRMYMAVAQEDRHPITDIMRQTPEIPENCQWAIFLRNHDELTLEMVTDRERDYLWNTYAADTRARINLGIRRRLAPLMQNDRRKIELMNALLLSMPGTPVMYYGDELGMGDNFYLGDRDGVRTPMQWSADRNGGFSRANPQQLYLPAVMDPVYGYQTVNVEAQQAEPSSLLNWVRRMIAVRKRHDSFGRGSFVLLYPRNRRVLAYVRQHEGETILCVANLSRSAQAVELDLSAYRGSVPIELLGQQPFPPIGDLPYLLTLPAHGFFWFVLASEQEVPSWHTLPPDPLPEFLTLTATAGLAGVLRGREQRQLEREVMPQFLQRQRWFGGKDAPVEAVTITHLATLDEESLLALVQVGDARYLLPLSALWGEENVQFGAPKLSYTLARVRRGRVLGALVDGAFDERFALSLIQRMAAGETVALENGSLCFEGNAALSAIETFEPVRPLTLEQSNVSVALGDKALLKIYRRLRPGRQPEMEVARFLSEQAGFANTPAYLGQITWRDDTDETVLATAFAYVQNQGDLWGAYLDALMRMLEDRALAGAWDTQPADGAEIFAYPLDLSRTLGLRTGEMHKAFAAETDDPAFHCEPLTAGDIAESADDTQRQFDGALKALEKLRPSQPQPVQAMIDRLVKSRPTIEKTLKAIRALKPSGMKSRLHGDYHLGQALIVQQDVFLIDFEGEPRRGLEERRAKSSPLRDVAGMLRSFDYLARTASARLRERFPDLTGAEGDSPVDRLALEWRATAAADFLDGYSAGLGDAPNQPATEQSRKALLTLFLLQKVFYEIGYEAANRPDWISIPLQGALDLLQESGS